MKRKMILGCGLVCIFWLTSVARSLAIELTAPEKVARGDAFIARVSDNKPADKFTFYWRGKAYPVIAIEEPDKGWVGEIMLPVPLDEKASSLQLGVGSGGKGLQEAAIKISFFDKKRPIQKLTVDKKYVYPPASEKARIERDRQKVRATLANPDEGKKWELPFKRPVQGTVSSQFGLKRVFNGEPRSVHRGLDLRGAEGTEIYACADGRVALVDDLYYSGKTVYLDHGDGVFTAYLHMSQPKVQTGQMLKRGDLVGLVGATGRVTGPHLHLSLLVQGESVDPSTLLEERQKEVKK